MQCLVTRMFASVRFPTIIVLLAFVLLAWGAVLPAAAQNLSGTVKSGTAPIPGATVTLYMAGYDRGIPPSVLSSTVSDASGHFVIKFPIKVPPLRANDVLYVTARGPLPSVDLAAMLGTYGNVSWFVSDFVVNELSTIATTWAMAQFMSGDDVGGKSPGLQNAAATVGNMVNVKTATIATVLATPPNGSQTTTLAEFNSLANLIAACVDTPVKCSQLFSLATPPGGTTPANTLQAALSIAHNPWNNVAQLFTLSQSNSNYAPVLPSAPDAWTIVLQYYGNGNELNGPGNMAVDAEGNIYVAINYDGQTNACGGKIVSKLTPTGSDAAGAPFKGGGVNGAGFGITIDPTGDIRIGNFGFAGNMCTALPAANSVSKFTPTGWALSPATTGWTGNGFIHSPQATVSDAAGNIWIANFTASANYVTELVRGDPFNVKTYVNNPNFKNAFGIALDAQNKVWVTSGPNLLTKIDPTTGQYQSYTAPGMDRPLGVAIDSLGNIWVANPAADFDSTSGGPGAVVAFDPSGNPLPGSPFTGGSISGPWGIAIDGNDNVWVDDWIGEHVTLLCGARRVKCPPGFATGQQISPPSGYTSNAMQRLTGVVIDQAGNVWVPNNWKTIPIQTNPGGFGMLEIVGAAAPVKAPVFGPPQQP
jgi:streptogramin lyase